MEVIVTTMNSKTVELIQVLSLVSYMNTQIN